MTINSRAKGKRIEREAAKFLEMLGFDGARRGVQYAGGKDSPDVVCEALPNVHLEIKGNEAIDVGTKLLDAACIQAASDANGKPWAVLWKRNRTAWRLTFESREPFATSTVFGDRDIADALSWLNTYQGGLATPSLEYRVASRNR
jgi:Holliday junction resolvase